MAIARPQLVDTSLTRWYHCVTRCVRKAFLLGEGENNRREWLENRLEELANVFAVAVGGFSVMDNHLHVLLRLDPDLAQGWSDDEAAELECPELAEPDREARRGSVAGPFLCVHPCPAAGHRRTARCAAPGQPEGLSGSMTRL